MRTIILAFFVNALLLAVFNIGMPMSIAFPTEREIWLHELVPSWLHRWLENTFSTASLYYRRQRPLFEVAAKRSRLHWYFAQTKGIDSIDLAYDKLVELRLRSMERMLREFGRDDFKIEKDKCAMYQFFLRNHLPTSPILKEWKSNLTFLDDLRKGRMFNGAQKYPMFVKCCHLTQYSSRSTFKVKSHEWAKANVDHLVQWARDKWILRADDFDRPWREVGNKLTNGLTPGFLLQAPAVFSRNDKDGEMYIYELRVEVLFGRAYLGLLSLSSEGTRSVFIRGDTDGDAECHKTVGGGSLLYLHRWFPSCDEARWILEEDHMPCVWALAERAARLMAIDQVRIDVFVSRGLPRDCVLNEISISSAVTAPAHKPFVAKLWAEAFMNRWYKSYGDAISVSVYRQTANNMEAPLSIGNRQ